MKYDATLKKTFRTPPNLLFSLALGRKVTLTRLLPGDLITVATAQPDLLFETADGELIHAELHGYGMQDFAVRNLGYFAGILRDFGRPPQQLVFWIGPGKVGVYDGLIFPPALDYRYRLIDVRDIEAELLLDDGAVEESIFAILCKLRDPREVVTGILRRIGELPPEDQREAVMMLLVLSGLRGLKTLVSEEVKRMPVSIDIHENEFLEDIFQQGLEKGLEQGKETSTRDLLVELAESRFGPLPASLRLRIESADLSQLQTWVRRAIRASSLDEIFP